ncbi:isopentenyl-diphosphate Delta-isomerase [Lutimaribacter marinistellae]|uniref:Isopentenyl-diphosphate Delta-isomerase n=1 Tax=Lutimaribacter marinistellae TaxID=1820329 RepID=A0ABV7TF27_9RHOB
MNLMIPAWVDGSLVPVEKLEAHERGLLHRAVSVFVLCGDDVLIQQRAMAKYHTPGLWANTCCTHPHWGEAPSACARRRLREELGLEGLDLQSRGQLTYRADVGGGLVEHERVDVFVAQVSVRPVPKPDPDEVMATDWVDMRELARRVERHPEAFTPWLRIYLTQHADSIFA